MNQRMGQKRVFVWFACDGTPWGVGARAGDAMDEATENIVNLSIEMGEGTEAQNLDDVIGAGNVAELLLPDDPASEAFLDHLLHGG